MITGNEAFARVVIDAQLAAQGWNTQDQNSVRYEVVLPDRTRADYVLCDRHGRALAVIEAKRFSLSPEAGAKQAQDYARQLRVRPRSLFRPGGTWIALRKLRSIQATPAVAQTMIMAACGHDHHFGQPEEPGLRFASSAPSRLHWLVTEDTAQRDAAVADVAKRVAQGEILRVLLVFAEAPGSRPLAMRLEREQLLALFYEKILPQHRVQIDVLCHGVTRALLREQIEAAGGYHIVHWSGHGHHNLLELRGPDGQPELLTGEQLVDLFIQAGGFIPQLVFLSACLSGTFVSVHDWATLR